LLPLPPQFASRAGGFFDDGYLAEEKFASKIKRVFMKAELARRKLLSRRASIRTMNAPLLFAIYASDVYASDLNYVDVREIAIEIDPTSTTSAANNSGK